MTKRTLGRPELIRQVNRTLVLDALKMHGPMSRPELAAQIGLSLPAVFRAVSDLEQEGLVREHGEGRSSGGRRPVLVEYNPGSAFILAADVSPYRITGAVVDLAGRFCCSLERRPAAMGPALVQDVIRFLHELMETSQVDRTRLKGVGITVPGRVLSGGEAVWAPALEWDSEPLKGPAEHVLNLPVFIENDVNGLLLGERWLGAAAGRRHSVAMLIGSGVGVAMMADEQLHRGRDFGAGEVGHWLLRTAGRANPRRFGALEGQLRLAEVARRWQAQQARASVPALPDAEEDAVSALLSAVGRGEAAAMAVIGETAELLGLVAANLVSLLNPEIVIIGGDVIPIAPFLLPRMQAVVDQSCPFPAPLVTPALGPRSLLLGAVYSVLLASRNSVAIQR